MGLRSQYTRHVVPPQTEGPEGSPYSVLVGITNSFGVMLGRSSQEIQEVNDGAEALQNPLHFSNSLAKGCSQIVSFMTLRWLRENGDTYMPIIRMWRKEDRVQGQPLLQ